VNLHPMTPLAPLPENRILVTGGAGFIGSATVWALNQARLRADLWSATISERPRNGGT
jgi:nucleoside-diphosphate-sugar epimerase